MPWLMCLLICTMCLGVGVLAYHKCMCVAYQAFVVLMNNSWKYDYEKPTKLNVVLII